MANFFHFIFPASKDIFCSAEMIFGAQKKSFKTVLFLKKFSQVSHVVEVEVLQIYYLLSCAGGWLSQHCCVVATAVLYKSQ